MHALIVTSQCVKIVPVNVIIELVHLLFVIRVVIMKIKNVSHVVISCVVCIVKRYTIIVQNVEKIDAQHVQRNVTIVKK